MPQKEVQKEVLDIAIFVLLFPAQRQCFVSKTPVKNLKSTYKRHYNGGNAKTKSVFLEAKRQGDLPPMYLLKQMQTTQEEAFLYCIAWTKYFQIKGFHSLSGDFINRYTENLKDETTKIYNEIKDKPLEKTCIPGKDLFPNYGRERQNNTRNNNIVAFKMAPKELKKVQEAARDNSISVSEYCRRMIRTGHVIKVDSSVIEAVNEQNKQLITTNRLLKQILLNVHHTGKYYPSDLEIIQKAITDNKEQQKKALTDFDKRLEKLLQ